MFITATLQPHFIFYFPVFDLFLPTPKNTKHSLLLGQGPENPALIKPFFTNLVLPWHCWGGPVCVRVILLSSGITLRFVSLVQ